MGFIEFIKRRSGRGPEPDYSHVQLPTEYTMPVEGVSLDTLALIHARMATAGSDRETTLAQYGLDPMSFGRIDKIWRDRMDGRENRMVGTILSRRFGRLTSAMSDEEETDDKPLGSDPLHSTDKFVSRHLRRAVVILIALGAIVFAHTFMNCTGG